jgi:hypothetical protein
VAAIIRFFDTCRERKRGRPLRRPFKKAEGKREREREERKRPGAGLGSD